MASFEQPALEYLNVGQESVSVTGPFTARDGFGKSSQEMISGVAHLKTNNSIESSTVGQSKS